MKDIQHNTTTAVRVGFAAAAVWVALATVCRADDVRQVHVGYADLNMQTEAGAAVLLQRIRNAAARVCDAPGTRDLGLQVRAKVCADRAIAAAVAEVKLPSLTKAYDAKYGGEPSFTKLAAR